MKAPTPPPLKKGNLVVFSPPVSVGEAPIRKGYIKDEVWSDPYLDADWGYYIYTSQLIEWENGGRSIRITYYYQPINSDRWFFGGQYSIEDTPEIIERILKATLQKKEWYVPADDVVGDIS